MCQWDWFNKEANWPIIEQDKIRRKSQTKKTGKKKNRYREKQGEHAILRKVTMSYGKA